MMNKSKNPLQATGHQICNETGRGIFDPRGSRQMDSQAHLPDSLPAGINKIGDPELRLRRDLGRRRR